MALVKNIRYILAALADKMAMGRSIAIVTALLRGNFQNFLSLFQIVQNPVNGSQAYSRQFFSYLLENGLSRRMIFNAL